jgi:hypothetical protein
MKNKLSIIFLLLSSLNLFAQSDTTVLKQNFYDAFEELNNMLSQKQENSFKRAVFITENAFYNNRLNYNKYCKTIEMYAFLAKSLMNSRDLIYQNDDEEKVSKLAAVFTIMTDTVPIMLDSGKIINHLPFTYDFEDFFGTLDWSKMFVTKLLETHKGNCHSLPYLYKIICEELKVNTYLAQAPNHFYIKNRNKQDGWYNTELTSGFFPIDAWLFASGYITIEAVRNGIYMDTLSLKQSISVCVVDLAKGYENKFGCVGDTFVIKCCNKSLEYYPNNITALLLKAETMKKQFDNYMKFYKTENPNEVLKLEEPGKLFSEMEKLYMKIYTLGYRTMPDEMYISWLMSLRTETEKYINPKLNTNFKTNKK